MLGLDLIVHGDGFRFRDPETGDILPDHLEAVTQRNRARRRTRSGRGAGGGTRSTATAVLGAGGSLEASVGFFMSQQVLNSPAQRQGAILRHRQGGDSASTAVAKSSGACREGSDSR